MEAGNGSRQLYAGWCRYVTRELRLAEDIC